MVMQVSQTEFAFHRRDTFKALNIAGDFISERKNLLCVGVRYASHR